MSVPSGAVSHGILPTGLTDAVAVALDNARDLFAVGSTTAHAPAYGVLSCWSQWCRGGLWPGRSVAMKNPTGSNETATFSSRTDG